MALDSRPLSPSGAQNLDATALLNAVRQGKPLVILDDRREHEGDLYCAAQVAEPEVLQFMVRRCSGFLCLAMPRPRLERIGIPRISSLLDLLMGVGVPRHRLPGPWMRFLESLADGADTPFHFPVDLRGLASGISVEDRYATIRALLDPGANVGQFAVPGHLPLLGAHPQGLKGRAGHTECATTLARLAGLEPAGLLCEIVGDDGVMARGEDLDRFVREYSLDVVTVTELVELAERAN